MEGDDVGVEADREGQGEEDDQRRTADGEQPVEGDRVDQGVLRDDQLQAHQQVPDEPEYEEGERGADEHPADVLVVGAGGQLQPARARRRDALGDQLGSLRGEGAAVTW